MKSLDVFDLDHTLIKVNSSFHFGVYLYRQKIYSLQQIFPCIWDYYRHKWLGMPIHALHLRIFDRLFKSRSLNIMQQYVEEFLKHHFSSFLNHKVVEKLKTAQAQGEHILILSSSPDFIVNAMANRLNVGLSQGTTYQTDQEGNFLAVDYVFEGLDKAAYVQQFALQRNIARSSITAYSDSFLDLPVLNMAGKVIAVGPDALLRRISSAKGWEIL